MSKLYSFSDPVVKEQDSCSASSVSNICSQTRITWEPKLSTGLDTLKMTFWFDFSNSNLFDALISAKNKAQEEDKDSEPVNLGGHEFNVMRTGVQMFQFRLIRGDIRILFSPRKHTSNIPNCRLEIGSLSSWTPGYNEVYKNFVKMMELLGGVLCKEKVSEPHLTVDLIGVDIKDTPVAQQEHWVTRAHTFSAHCKHKKLTGVSIGSGDLMLRIYDKVEELKISRHKIDTFLDLWGIEDLEAAPVTRIEFQLRRSILKEFKIAGKAHPINTLEDLNECLSSVWSYLINEWARLSDKPVDRDHNHQSRAQNHEIWQLLHDADFSGGQIAIRSTTNPICDLPSLRLQMAGLGMTIAAALGRASDDLESIIAFSQGALEATIRRLFKDKKDFIKRMDRKHNRLSTPFQDSLDVAFA